MLVTHMSLPGYFIVMLPQISSPDGAERNPGSFFLDFTEPVLSEVEGFHPGYGLPLTRR
jgi:hypothetical protein